MRIRGAVVSTSALHAEGRGLDPRRVYLLFFLLARMSHPVNVVLGVPSIFALLYWIESKAFKQGAVVPVFLECGAAATAIARFHVC